MATPTTMASGLIRSDYVGAECTAEHTPIAGESNHGAVRRYRRLLTIIVTSTGRASIDVELYRSLIAELGLPCSDMPTGPPRAALDLTSSLSQPVSNPIQTNGNQRGTSPGDS